MSNNPDPTPPNELGPPVEFKSTTGEQPANQTAEIQCRQSMGIVPAKQIVYEAIVGHSDRILMDFTAQGVASQVEVDGVWQALPALDRQNGDMMLAVFKTLAHLNPQDRVNQQVGEFKAMYGKEVRTCQFTSVGTQTGERVIIKLISKEGKFDSLSDLGIREPLVEAYKRLSGRHEEDKDMQVTSGMVVIATPPNGGGLSTFWDYALRATDRFMRDFVCFETPNMNETDVENILVDVVDPNQGKSLAASIEAADLRQIDVYLVPQLADKATLERLCYEVNTESKQVFISVRATDGIDALHTLRGSGVAPAMLAQAVNGVLHMRLCRRLCENCKQPFQPNPQYVQQLGLPPSHVEVLYQQYQPVPDEQGVMPEPCPVCLGRGFVGRIGIFELTEITEPMRQALTTEPNPDKLRQLSAQQGNQSTLTEGMLLVAQGITSVQELQRAMGA
jgi:type II secretory ATPase GspE/PulE/Tfp pilus assembly ATPase PilB-like protein